MIENYRSMLLALPLPPVANALNGGTSGYHCILRKEIRESAKKLKGAAVCAGNLQYPPNIGWICYGSQAKYSWSRIGFPASLRTAQPLIARRVISHDMNKPTKPMVTVYMNMASRL